MGKLPPVIDPAHDQIATSVPTEQSFIVKLRPQSSVTGSNKVDFSTNKNPNCCIDTSATQLSVRFRIIQKDGSAFTVLEKDKYVGTINNILGSFFNSMTISINSQQIYQTNNQHLLDYFSTILNYSSEYRQNVLYSSGWDEESGVDVGKVGSAALKNNCERVALSKEVYCIGKIKAAFFQQGKFLPINTQLSLSLVQSPNDLFLLTNVADVRVELLDCELHLRYVKLTSPVLSALQSALDTTPYLIPLKRTEIRTFTLSSGLSSYTAHNLHLGKIPNLVYFCMIPTSSFKGEIASSTYAFSHANLNNFKFFYNDVVLPGIKFNMEKKDSIELFNYVSNQLNLQVNGQTPGFSHLKFANNFFIVAQSLSSDVSVSALSSPGSVGTLGLELGFSTALTASHTLVLVSQFEKSCIKIDKDQVTISE